jgi:membrane protein YdbS with pleckstrin-like domain
VLEALRPLLLRALRVPAEPATPAEDVRVFRASGRYFRYRAILWCLRQTMGAMVLLVGLAIARFALRDLPEPAATLIAIGEAVAVVAFLLLLPVSWAMLRLDFEMRWYVLGARSLRIREGILSVREQTMTYANIQNLEVRQGPLQRLLGIADVEVRTAGGGGQAHPQGGGVVASMHVGRFRGVDDPHAIRDSIRERVLQHRDSGLGDPDEAPAAALAAGSAPGDALVAAREVLAAARTLRAALEPGRPAV